MGEALTPPARKQPNHQAGMPDWKQHIRTRLAPLALDAQRELEIVEELALHLEAVYDAALDRGAGEDEAVSLAQAQIRDSQLLECEMSRVECTGSQTHSQTVSHYHKAGGAMEILWQDLRYGIRKLLKQPGLAALAIITLALGIGANTAVFSVVDAVLLKPLPYGRPDQLTLIWASFEQMAIARAPASGTQWHEIRARSRTLADLGAIWVGNGTLLGEAEPEQIKLGSVTANFFTVLEAAPLLGRTFLPEEQGPGTRRSIILSHGLWQRRYGADVNIIGRTIRLNGREASVVGVMPPEFQLQFPPDANVPAETQAWIPFGSDLKSQPRDLYYLRLVGRLQPDVSIEQAQAEMPGLAQQLREQYREYASENLKLEIVPLHGDAVREVRPALLALLAGAALVLLIACVNIANLLLARARTRQQEMVVRAALGASRWRIVRQLLSESLLLGVLGGMGGLGLGWWGLRLLLQLLPDSLMRVGSVQLNPTVLSFVTLVSLLSVLLFGLAPALATGRTALTELLKARGVTGSGRQRAQTLLIICEIALSVVLLIGAGLMLRTLLQVQKVDPGFNVQRAPQSLTFEINPAIGFPASRERINFVTQFAARLAALPGVETVGAISHLPLDDYPNWYSPYARDGMTETEKKGLMADHRAITPEYFSAIGTTLISGRSFDGQDTADSRTVVVIDDLLARQAWPNESAVGRLIECESFQPDGSFVQRKAEIVGIVRHVRHHSLTKEVRGQIYIPYAQSAREHLSFVVRTGSDPTALITPARQALASLNPNLALSKVRPFSAYTDKALAPVRFITLLAGIFGALALLLALIGIYGVVSYSVSQRTREIGVRLALGAQARDVLTLVIRHGMRPALAGVAIGLAGALALTRFMAGLLFGVQAVDPLTFCAVALLLLVVALLACWVPARRATRVDPMLTLRCE